MVQYQLIIKRGNKEIVAGGAFTNISIAFDYMNELFDDYKLNAPTPTKCLCDAKYNDIDMMRCDYWRDKEPDALALRSLTVKSGNRKPFNLIGKIVAQRH